jgi:hypothetical protein
MKNERNKKLIEWGLKLKVKKKRTIIYITCQEKKNKKGKSNDYR